MRKQLLSKRHYEKNFRIVFLIQARQIRMPEALFFLSVLQSPESFGKEILNCRQRVVAFQSVVLQCLNLHSIAWIA